MVERWFQSVEWLGGGRAQEQSWASAERVLDGFEGLSEQERDVVGSRWLIETRRYDELATALVGLSVAILTGLDSLFRLAERWRQARFTAAVMVFEGWRFVGLLRRDLRESRKAGDREMKTPGSR